MTNPIYAKVICDSVNPKNTRITTLEIQLPKVLLAEFNTHRVFSRSFVSSRAVPSGKFTELPSFEPTFYGKNQSGMVAKDEVIENEEEARQLWYAAICESKKVSERLTKLQLHKQWSNRPNDWHIMVRGIVTATEWDNFFGLRCHPDAQPEMRVLAEAMRTAIGESTPTELKTSYKGRSIESWHLPYVTDEEKSSLSLIALQIHSVARCCRASYNNHGKGKTTLAEDTALVERLKSSKPIHASPFEHQAIAVADDRESAWLYGMTHIDKHGNDWSGNFKDWVQFRQILEV